MPRFLRELTVQYGRIERPEAFQYNNAEDVFRAFKHLARKPREHVAAILLDGKNRSVAYETVAIGTNQASLVSAANVFQGALLANATRLILVHCHPSGDPTPSLEDRRMTTRIRAIGELLGIELIDHVIIAGVGFYSFSDHDQFTP